jgi:acetyl esterase/lipase
VWTIDEATLGWHHYLDGRTPATPYAAPARATSYAGLPPTFISINAIDSLRDEALTLGRRMATDGVDVDLRMYARTLHGSALIGMDIAAGEAINRDQYAAVRAVIDAQNPARPKETRT